MKKSLLILVGAFVLVGLVPNLGIGPWAKEYLEPNSFKYGPHSNVVSAVPYFLRALVWGLLSVVLTEAFKILNPHDRVISLLAWVFQVCLLIDSIRLHALDWFAYLLNYLGIADIAVGYGVEKGTILASPIPWISAIPLLLTLWRAYQTRDPV